MYVYSKGDHPGKFIGARVAVTYGRTTYQKYFGIRKYKNQWYTLLQDAIAYENKLLKKKEQYNKKHGYFKPSKRKTDIYNVGLKGVSLRFVDATKTYSSNRSLTGTEFYPSLICQIRNQKGKVVNFSVNLELTKLNQAWRELLLFYKNNKDNFTNKYYRQYLNNPPVIELLLVQYYHLIQKGTKISAIKLPKELDSSVVLTIMEDSLLPKIKEAIKDKKSSINQEFLDWFYGDILIFKQSINNFFGKRI